MADAAAGPPGQPLAPVDAAISALRLEVLGMGGLVVDQVTTAVQALLGYDRDAAELVLARERRINAYDTAIEAAGFELLARQAPVAGDLRAVLAMAHAVTDLERAGDEAKRIARFALATMAQPGFDPSVAVHRHLRHMAHQSARMLRLAIDALDRGDASVAHEVARMDREIDREFEAALRELLTVALESPGRVRATIDTVFALKSLERIGDHAKNVAERVVFIVSGKDVRHGTRSERRTANS